MTGITVNQFPNVKRKFIREISMMLHIWDKYGLESARKRHLGLISEALKISEEEVSDFREMLRGKINFLGMVRGKNDSIYLKYLGWYCSLSSRERSS